MASPRPDPPKRRLMVLSAWTKSSNRGADTLRRNTYSGIGYDPFDGGSTVDAADIANADHDLARLRELHRIRHEIEQHLPDAAGIAGERRPAAMGQSTVRIELVPLADARGSRMLTALCTTAMGEKASVRVTAFRPRTWRNPSMSFRIPRQAVASLMDCYHRCRAARHPAWYRLTCWRAQARRSSACEFRGSSSPGMTISHGWPLPPPPPRASARFHHRSITSAATTTTTTQNDVMIVNSPAMRRHPARMLSSLCSTRIDSGKVCQTRADRMLHLADRLRPVRE